MFQGFLWSVDAVLCLFIKCWSSENIPFPMVLLTKKKKIKRGFIEFSHLIRFKNNQERREVKQVIVFTSQTDIWLFQVKEFS